MTKEEFKELLRKAQEEARAEEAKESPERRARVLEALRKDQESNRPDISIDEDSDPAKIRATMERFMKK